MPILRREPEMFPAAIFAVAEPWRVAHVRSRQEKSLARYLKDYAIPYYLPQSEKVVSRAGRTIISYIPLFASYLFFRGSDASIARALRSHVIVNVLTPLDQATFHEELLQLHRLQRTHGRLTVHPELKAGDTVLISEGAFAGFRGVIVRARSIERLIVSISFLRQAVSVDIDREAIRPQQLHVARNA